MTQRQRVDEVVRGWFAGRLPTEWFVSAPEITIDREEITVLGEVAAPQLADDAPDAERAAAWAGRIKAFPGLCCEVGNRLIDATVFPLDGIRQAPVSPGDGRLMRRADAAELEALMEHP